ncbi:uncharacterized protein [Glycine max]|uniref:uncharacterized protein isoform X1 n=1 Tax=Glycine max TaxID=3847 RepID=UPI001B354C8D|nr:uncharacterized protein LOC100799722 isoform X1 [Glycine max]
MSDWAPVLIGVVLFVLLQPGLLFSFPGNREQLEFGSMKTNGKAIFIHTLIFFALYYVLILAVKIHIYTSLTNSQDLRWMTSTNIHVTTKIATFMDGKTLNYRFNINLLYLFNI